MTTRLLNTMRDAMMKRLNRDPTNVIKMIKSQMLDDPLHERRIPSSLPLLP